LFLNSGTNSYLRGLEGEFNESTNAIRIELNRFERTGFLLSTMEGNRKVFRANQKHPLYQDINNILRKYVGLDQIVENVVQKLGSVKRAYFVGDIAIGLDVKLIELVLIGNGIDQNVLMKYIRKAEQLIRRKIIYFIVGEEQEKLYLRERKEAFLIWESQEK